MSGAVSPRTPRVVAPAAAAPPPPCGGGIPVAVSPRSAAFSTPRRGSTALTSSTAQRCPTPSSPKVTSTPRLRGNSAVRVTSVPANQSTASGSLSDLLATSSATSRLSIGAASPRDSLPLERRGGTRLLTPANQQPQEPVADVSQHCNGNGIGRLDPRGSLKTIASRPLSQDRIRQSPARVRVELTPRGHTNGFQQGTHAPSTSMRSPKCSGSSPGAVVKMYGRAWTPRRDSGPPSSPAARRSLALGVDSDAFSTPPVRRVNDSLKSPSVNYATEPIAAGPVRRAASTSSLPLRRSRAL